MSGEMMRLLTSEHLKMKRTFAKKLIWLCPAVLILLAFFMMGGYLYQCAYNMWYCFFVPVQTALICALIHQKEAKQLNYYRVFTASARLRSVWYSKTALATIYLWVSAVLFCLLVGVTAAMVQGTAGVRWGSAVTAVAVTIVCSMWQIPFYLWLAKKGGFFLPIVVSMAGCVLEAIFAVKSFWWICPYAWASRLMCTVLGILPNGLLAEDGLLLISRPAITGTLVCGIALYLLLTWITGAGFEKEVK